MSRVAHEIKNPLNGLSLNLEVVRSRAARSGTAPASSLEPYAEAAASELQLTAELVEALLVLARPGRTPVDLWTVLQPLARMYRAIAVSEGGNLIVEHSTDELSEAAVDGYMARLALASTLDVLVEGAAQIRGTIIRQEGEEGERGKVGVDFRSSLPPAELAAPIKKLLKKDGVELYRSPQGITILFAAL